MTVLLNDIDKNDLEVIGLVIAAIAALLGYITLVKNKRQEMNTVIFKRADRVNSVWKELTSIRNPGYTTLEPLIKYGRDILPQDYEIWSPLVTELVQSIEIIDDLSRSRLFLLDKKKSYQLFKKSLDVQVLESVMNKYNSQSLQLPHAKEVIVFKAQMERIRSAFVTFN